MRVISMQGRVVWEILQRDKVYYADKDLLREDNDYIKDIKRLNGYIPIWCYRWSDLSFHSMYNGEVLEYLRMEMSLEQKNCWDSFVMLELDIPDDSLIGYTHNASENSVIIPRLSLDMVKAVYTVRDANKSNPYWKIIKPIWISETGKHDVITETELNCELITEMEESISDDFVAGKSGKCLWCKQECTYTVDGKHFCSLSCKWEHERRFIYVLRRKGISRCKALYIHASLTDADFANGVVKAARNIVSNK